MTRRLATRYAVALLAAFATGAGAQPYPNKPIRVINPAAPGGNSDIVFRVIAPKMGEIVGQQFVLDYRAGAGGVIGADMDRRCAVWFCRFALRALGEYRQPMGLGAGPVECTARVRARTGRFHRRCSDWRGDFKPQRRQRGLVSARSARCLSACVSGEPHLLH